MKESGKTANDANIYILRKRRMRWCQTSCSKRLHQTWRDHVLIESRKESLFRRSLLYKLKKIITKYIFLFNTHTFLFTTYTFLFTTHTFLSDKFSDHLTRFSKYSTKSSSSIIITTRTCSFINQLSITHSISSSSWILHSSRWVSSMWVMRSSSSSSIHKLKLTITRSISNAQT